MPKHIVVVDDDPNTRVALSMALTRCGYEVTLASDGEEALEMIHDASGNNHHIDLAIVDIHLPKMSGSHLITELKKEPKHVPVFLVAGYTDKEFLIDILDKGIAKPFEHLWAA